MTERERIIEALGEGGLIDITTRGWRSGRARRIEITFFNVGGRVYISGLPGKRAWVANLAADPHLIFHLKRGVTADLPATARIISDEAERRPVLAQVCRTWNREHQLEAFVARSPLVEITFEESLLAA